MAFKGTVSTLCSQSWIHGGGLPEVKGLCPRGSRESVEGFIGKSDNQIGILEEFSSSRVKLDLKVCQKEAQLGDSQESPGE